MRGQVVGDVRVHHDLVAVDHRAHGVEVHRGALLGDGYGEHGVRGPVGEDLAGQALDPRGRRTLPDADGQDARREQQYVATLDVLAAPTVDLRCRDEPGVVGVDQLGELALPAPRRHREGGDRHLVADPHARVAGEEQVGQRVDQEVVAGQQAGHQPEPAAHLVVAQAGGQHVRELLGREVAQGLVQVVAQRVPEPEAEPVTASMACAASVCAGQGLDEQLGQVEHLDAAGTQRLGERVVLLLRPGDPGDPVEQQLVVVARGQPLELGPGRCSSTVRRRPTSVETPGWVAAEFMTSSLGRDRRPPP